MAKDYSKVPYKVTLTNIDKGIADPFSKTGYLADPTQEGKFYEPKDVTVQFYRTNNTYTIPAKSGTVGEDNNVLIIVAQTSAEAAYYDSLNSDSLKVELGSIGG